MKRRLIGLPVFAAMIAGDAAANEQVGAWSVSEKVSPLTNATAVTATVDSAEQLANQVGQPERAQLVMRCQEGTLALYVAWPQVLDREGESILLQLPETMVLYKTDNQPI